jgi:hypothetical protein
MIDQTLFKKHFVGRDGFQWWIGQIPPEESWRENIAGEAAESNTTAKGFGERYRVRILGYHTANADDIPDDELPWAYVMYPVTAGGGGRGSSQSANLTQGTFVFGWFMDGDDAQLPIIMGVLGHNDYAAVMKNVTPTRFLPFDGYPEQDEVFGEERSTLQVKKGSGGDVLQQENAQGQQNTNDQYTSSAQSNTSQLTASDVDPPPKDTIPKTSECEKSPLGDIQNVLQNLMNEVHKLNAMIYDAKGAITAGIKDAQRYIDNLIGKATNAIAGAMKWIFTEIEKFVLKQINGITSKTHSLVFPNLREPLRLGIAQANDIIVCIFRKLINELPSMIGGFISDMIGDLIGSIEGGIPSPTKVVNVPRCFIEGFVGTTIGNVANQITDSINQALSAVSDIAGAVGDVIGDVMGFIEDIIAFISCDDNPQCPSVNEWSIWSGPGSKGGDSNLSSLLESAKNVSSSVTQLGSKAQNSLSGLGEIDFGGVFEGAQCDLGPRPCSSPTVEYIGDGIGAQINLIISSTGEVMGGDVISSGIGYNESRSYVKVYDDCGIGHGAVIKPIFGPVDPVFDEDFDPNLPIVYPDYGTGRPGDENPSGNGSGSDSVFPGVGGGGDSVFPGVGEGNNSSIPGTPGAGPIAPNKPSKTKPKGPRGEEIEICRSVSFKIVMSAGGGPEFAPIRVRFTLIGDIPDYSGDSFFEFDVTDRDTTITQCVYPNQDYLVTASSLPSTSERIQRAADDGLYDIDDPDNISLRITRGPQSGDARYGDHKGTDREGFTSGNGLWADFKDKISDDRPLGSAGPRDLQIYPSRGQYKEIDAISDHKVIYRLKADRLPSLPDTSGEDPIGIVDLIVIHPGFDYLPAPDGSTGGDGDVWQEKDETVIIGGDDDDPPEFEVQVPNKGKNPPNHPDIWVPTPGDGGLVPDWNPEEDYVPGDVVKVPTVPGTDYYPPIPPGNTVPVPPGGIVTTPPTSEVTEGTDNEGNSVPILPGVPTPFPGGGTITTPPIGGGGGGAGDGGSLGSERFTQTRYPSTSAYPVILYLCEVIIQSAGVDYKPTDTVVIEPNMGATAVPKFDQFGRLLSVKVTAGGEGFQSMPKLYIKTETGFGAKILPKFCIDRIGIDDLERNPELQDKVISVVDCVGKI